MPILSALLHMDGEDGATTFPDMTGKAWTAVGSAQIDTGQSVFGGASALFAGDGGDYITTPDHEDFNFGALDFTIDFRARHDALRMDGYRHYVSQFPGAWAVYKNITDHKPSVILQTDGGDKIAASSMAVTSATWYHIAVARYGNTVTIYLDGTARGTVDVTGCTINNDASVASIGAYEGGGDVFGGWIDEVRITKGMARWTANFTPPTAAYALGGGGQILILAAERWKGFLRDLRAGLVPPDQLRRRYRDLVTI